MKSFFKLRKNNQKQTYNRRICLSFINNCYVSVVSLRKSELRVAYLSTKFHFLFPGALYELIAEVTKTSNLVNKIG